MDVRSLIVSLSVLIACPAARAAQFYVSPTGSDSAAGSSAAPWKTLQHAANVVGPGDRVTARPGNYAGFYLDTSGTAASPIEFFAEPGVLVNQPNPVRTDQGINLENASWITIDGFEVSGMNRAGVRTVGVDGSTFATNVTIRNVKSHDNGYWGILTGFVNNLLIENNITYGSVNEHGIYVSNSGDNPTIRNNESYNNRANGIHMNGDAEQGGDGIITGALVAGNKIYNNGVGGGSGINMDGVQNSRIENNLIYNNHASGISLYRIDGGGGASGNTVINNTIIQASDARWAINIRDGSTGNTARNNILLNNHPSRGAISISADSLSGFTSDYNAVISRFTTNDGNSVQTLAQWQASTGQDSHSFVATASALFANVAANDYHLKTGSPAINTGTNSSAPPADFAGLPRPAGAAYDIGAYEFGALLGDYNRDGKVNSSDYVVWRNSLGTSVTRYAGADGDGNGKIEQADYAKWRAGFGATTSGLGAGAEVPEPSSLILLGLALMFTRSARLMAGGL
jgi:parallel beta-helix repeat protein